MVLLLRFLLCFSFLSPSQMARFEQVVHDRFPLLPALGTVGLLVVALAAVQSLALFRFFPTTLCWGEGD